MQYISLSEAKAKLSYVLDQIEKGEEIVITRMGKPTAHVTAYVEEKNKKPRVLGFMQGQGRIYGDFHEWPEEEARALGIID